MRRVIPTNAFRADIGQRLGTERDEQGRVWCQLFPLGEWYRKDFPNGHLNLTSDVMSQFVANWRSAGSPALPVDYEHDESGPASGWIENLRLSSSGELEAAIKWTDEAAADIKADRRRYLSPTWTMTHSDRRSGELGGPWLYGAALTNSPFYDSMPRVAASSADADETTQPPDVKEKHNMIPELKKRCALALKCAEDCTDEDLVAAIEAKCQLQAAAQESEGKLTAALKTAGDETAKLTARIGELEATASKHAEELFERDFKDIFDAGLAAGRKGLPAMRDTLHATAKAMGAKGLETVKTLIASMGEVPLTTTGISGKDAGAPDAKAASSEVEAFIAEQMKAGKSFVEAQRAANFAHREAVEKSFAVVTTKPQG